MISDTFARQFKKNPYLVMICGSATAGLAMLGYMGYHKVKHDPTLVFDKHKDPFPYLRVKQNENVKLYAVGLKTEKYEAKYKETFL